MLVGNLEPGLTQVATPAKVGWAGRPRGAFPNPPQECAIQTLQRL